MFTGIIEAVCTIRTVAKTAETAAISADLAELSRSINKGDSIAINGVCLTVASITGCTAVFDVSRETLAGSNLGGLSERAKVNVERAIRADGRFGGHMVLGHVDGTATIRAIRRRGRFAEMQFAARQTLLELLVAKGSVAVDGVSLTVAELQPAGFAVAVIPETLANTTLGVARVGDKVNIEIDIITKSVKRLLDNILPRQETLTAEKLKGLGF